MISQNIFYQLISLFGEEVGDAQVLIFGLFSGINPETIYEAGDQTGIGLLKDKLWYHSKPVSCFICILDVTMKEF